MNTELCTNQELLARLNFAGRTNRPTDEQTDRQTDQQTNRLMDKQTLTDLHNILPVIQSGIKIKLIKT